MDFDTSITKVTAGLKQLVAQVLLPLGTRAETIPLPPRLWLIPWLN